MAAVDELGPVAIRTAIQLLRSAGYQRVGFARDIRTRQYELHAESGAQMCELRLAYEDIQRAERTGNAEDHGRAVAMDIEAGFGTHRRTTRIADVIAGAPQPRDGQVLSEAMRLLHGRGYEGRAISDSPMYDEVMSLGNRPPTHILRSVGGAVTVQLRRRGAQQYAVQLVPSDLDTSPLALADYLDNQYRRANGMRLFSGKGEAEPTRSSPLEGRVRELETQLRDARALTLSLMADVAARDKIINAMQGGTTRPGRRVRARRANGPTSSEV